MRTRLRSLTPILAAAGGCAAIAMAPVASAPAAMHDHRSQHDAVPDQRKHSDRHLTQQNNNWGGWPWWGGGGIVIGLGGWGW